MNYETKVRAHPAFLGQSVVKLQSGRVKRFLVHLSLNSRPNLRVGGTTRAEAFERAFIRIITDAVIY